MKRSRTEPDRLAELRKRAEAKLGRKVIDTPEMSQEEARKLVHELQTHQIELELQNEELRSAQIELVESRDRYSDLYDFAPVGYVTVDHKGLIMEANLTLARMLGVERRALVNRLFSAFIYPDDQDVFYRQRRRILESKQRDTCRIRLLRRDTEPLWTEIESILIEADDEHDARLRTVVSDITGRKHAEEEKRTLERQLKHAQKFESLGVMAGGIAHDFNNLLTAILGNADLALEELSPTSPARGHLREIEIASRSAAVLANQMLAYSGKSRLAVEPIDIGKLVEEMAYLFEVSIAKRADFKYNSSEDLPSFDGDVTQIRQVIMNLITNAVESVGDEGGIITLSTGAMDCDRAYLDEVNQVLQASLDEPLPEGKYVYLEVADTGSGMDAETIEKTFDPFFTTKFTGRGLGLSTVLGITRGHKGAIKINSEVGKGTRLRVLFPANDPSKKGFAVRVEDEAEKGNWRGRGTVLVADDDEAVCAVSEQMLELMGFSVLTAPDGREALRVFRKHADEIVCVLLDLTMPHMDGVEAFHEMRRLRPGVKVILCSGYSEQDATERFAGDGLAGFIGKPFNMAVLRTAFMEILYDPTSDEVPQLE